MSKEKQIEEMVFLILENCPLSKISSEDLAEILYDEGYRKQSAGCKFCGTTLYIKTIQYTMPNVAPVTRADQLRHELLNLTGEVYLPLEVKYCPLCGAKMKGV